MKDSASSIQGLVQAEKGRAWRGHRALPYPHPFMLSIDLDVASGIAPGRSVASRIQGNRSAHRMDRSTCHLQTCARLSCPLVNETSRGRISLFNMELLLPEQADIPCVSQQSPSNAPHLLNAFGSPERTVSVLRI